ncbi:hypothetical protein CI1B_42180 [Bradyrhizobium ivorense]|uniref:N-acetyltransferase domain-containing protein n=1 Tax=Bradyrhizobium ivorense TaxID=2511166 RepID=A0A508TC06_9BRAD|nr:GNAT family N-acetyltransferase [Bradyrhizobium ivorense]VIO72573.1 hypothetical protein CI1B_42180 [Bradyrhizobium ivorense]
MDAISYSREPSIGVDEFIDVLRQSGLGERRPIADSDRIGRMIANANLIVTARKDGKLVGVSRALTDFCFCCYLSDLAVDRAYQGHGIGKRLIEETRRHAGPESMCLLLSAPGATSFYKSIGMPQADNAFLYKRER